MWKKALVLSSFLAAVACSGIVTSEVPGEVVTTSNLKVNVAVSGLSLGDEGCNPTATAAKPAAAPANCAPPGERAGSGAPSMEPSGDVAPGCGGGFTCRQTSVQLSFKATNEGSSAPVQITRVVLLEETDSELQDLASSNPRAWTEAGYAVWDQTIAPGAELKASYALTAPTWSKHGASYSKRYKVRVTVQVGDQTTTVDSAATNREAPVAT